VYAGIPYRVVPDNSIVAMMPGGLVKFKNMDQLMAAAEGPSATNRANLSKTYESLGFSHALVPVSEQAFDYYSVLKTAIKSAEQNSAQIRELIYERARFNMRRDLLLGHSSLSMTDLMRQLGEFELAVARIEADTASCSSFETHHLERGNQVEEFESSQGASTGRETAELIDADISSLSRTTSFKSSHQPDNITEIADDGHRGSHSEANMAEPCDLETTENRDGGEVRSRNSVQVLGPAANAPNVAYYPVHRLDEFRHERRPEEVVLYARGSNIFIGILFLGLLFISTAIVAGVIWNTSKAPSKNEITSTAGKADVVRSRNKIADDMAEGSAAAPPKLSFPLPSSYGIYALSDNKLVELHALPINVPDARVALSAELRKPSDTLISDNTPAFIVFRRDLLNNAPQKITLRVIARMARETDIVDAKATVKQTEGAWRIRSNSREFRVSPVPGHREMIIARLEKGEPLAAGRYALVLNRTGYDVTIKGDIKSPMFCLEKFETANGSIFNQCRAP
jgi:hypothetical protein